jgi:hypothetical protein
LSLQSATFYINFPSFKEFAEQHKMMKNKYGMQPECKKEICNKSGSNKINIKEKYSIHASTEANCMSIFPPSSSKATVGAQQEDAYENIAE